MINKVTLVGRVGSGPEIKVLGDSKVANFSLATSESFTNKNGEKVTNTEWHNIEIWRGLADVVERYVNKGDLLFLEGKIKTRQYEDKDGNKRYSTSIVCDTLKMLGGKKEAGTSDAPSVSNSYNPPYQVNSQSDSDDLPFS